MRQKGVVFGRRTMRQDLQLGLPARSTVQDSTRACEVTARELPTIASVTVDKPQQLNAGRIPVFLQHND